jgi:hypothetical protein
MTIVHGVNHFSLGLVGEQVEEEWDLVAVFDVVWEEEAVCLVVEKVGGSLERIGDLLEKVGDLLEKVGDAAEIVRRRRNRSLGRQGEEDEE